MNKTIYFSTPYFYLSLLLILVLLTNCNKALVRCGGDLKKYHSESGYVNTTNYQMGTIVIIDSVQKKAYSLGTYSVDIATLPTSPKKTDTLSATTDFNISFSGKIASTNNQSIQAEAKTAINNNSMFTIKNGTRKDINDKQTFVNTKDPTFLASIIKTLKQNPNTVVMFIGTIIYGDELNLGVKSSLSSDVTVNTITISDLKIHVSYSCSDVVKFTAVNGGLLYKPIYFTMDPDGISLFVTTKIGFDLSTIDQSAGTPGSPGSPLKN